MNSSALLKVSLKLARKAIPSKLDCLCLPPTHFSNGILKDCFQVHSTQRENRDLSSERLYSNRPLICRNCSFIQTTKQEGNANISVTLLEHLEDSRFIVQQFFLFSAKGKQRKKKPRKASPTPAIKYFGSGSSLWICRFGRVLAGLSISLGHGRFH